MRSASHFAFLFLFAVSATHAATIFPGKHPVNLKEAQAEGLQRLSAEDLKAFIPGTQESQGVKGKGAAGKLRVFHPDGSFEVEGGKGAGEGKWRIDTNANTWCRTIRRTVETRKQREKGDAEQCYAVFRAPDGVHYFDYDVGDGFYAGVWRPQSK